MATDLVDDRTEYWTSLGVSRARLPTLIKRADQYPSLRTRDSIRQKLETIADAVGGATVREAARLVAIAPALLGYNPATIGRKFDTLGLYFIGVDIKRMVLRQPTLLLRDLEGSVPSKARLLTRLLPDANVAAMIERQPALLGADEARLARNLDQLAALLPRADIAKIVELAPCLLQYDVDASVALALQKWRSLLPLLDLDALFEKAPTLLQLDFDVNIAPKVRALAACVERQPEDGDESESEHLARLVMANPTYLAYSRAKFGRLLFERHAASGALDDSAVRRTLRSDTDYAHWLARVGLDADAYCDFLLLRLEAADRTASMRPHSQRTSPKAVEDEHSRRFEEVEVALVRLAVSLEQ